MAVAAVAAAVAAAMAALASREGRRFGFCASGGSDTGFVTLPSRPWEPPRVVAMIIAPCENSWRAGVGRRCVWMMWGCAWLVCCRCELVSVRHGSRTLFGSIFVVSLLSYL